MSTLIGIRSLGRAPVRVGGKKLSTTQTTLINLDNPRHRRALSRAGSIASSYIQSTAPLFQNDDGTVDFGGKVSVRAATLVTDVSAVNFTRASGVKGTGAAGTATVGAADGTNPRVDTVVVDTTAGTYSVIAGTATAGTNLVTLAGRGTVPANRIVLAYVLVPTSATTLSQANVLDARP